jgi:hypothetical protein
MVLEPVEFYDQDAIDQQVDPAHAIEMHLRLNIKPVCAEQDSGDGLER